VESELFGHERGAFTGATGRQIGKLAAANRGTIFLDEIGDISLAVQAKLLRAIETRRVYRLGSSQSVDLDVRILAATNQELQQAVQEKRFRSDLFYRLNVLRIEVPPLRHRLEDLPLLVQYYVRHFNREFGRRIGGLSPRAIDALHQHHWPGNIRELRNIIEVLFVNLAPETVGLVDVPPQVMRQLTHAVASPPSERDRMLNALVSLNRLARFPCPRA
jgi:transcriptional regulator with PAS, ATPase and Fis domain